ncbi:MAG: hypothetical protein JWL77_402 [Chthonomonadaceae bacterium]|nr:hypothetical protein [Chthonomonadaceae bacterium]
MLTKLHNSLNAYSCTVERRQWSPLPVVSLQQDGQVIPYDQRYLINQLAQAAGWSVEATPPLHHEFVVRSMKAAEGYIVIKAEAEIEIYSEGGDLFLWRLPVTVEFTTVGADHQIRAVIYDTSHLRIERLAAWRRSLIYAMAELRTALATDRTSPPLVELESVARKQLPPVITIGVDDASVGPLERRVLGWAVSKAIDQWNLTLQGNYRLLRLEGKKRTNIRIQAIPVPIAGGILGSCAHQNGSRGFNSIAEKHIRVLTAACPGSNPLPLAPERLCRLVEHELGHALGLADTNHRDCIMSGQAWNEEMPGSGISERASILRWHELYVRYVQSVCDQWNHLNIGFGVLLPKQGAVPQEDIPLVYRSLITRKSLVPDENWMAQIWEGECLLRQGNWQQAIVVFEAAALSAPDPLEATMRKHLVAILNAPNPRPSITFLESTLHSRHVGWEATDPVHLHRNVAFGYGRLGENAKDALHMALAEWIAAKRRIWWRCERAVENRSVRGLLLLIGPCVHAARCSIRVVHFKVRRHR